ncbi:uncharacterized protein LOC118143221 [Callithrix jacchus]|uniref:uncharacterized protein LOC118143221 n=1 Tax=Callithrix jacchus TaxID=9483 RepID=UPI0001D410EE|nr:uncharacterized protein LOC118143221 [Callithrix jacchus]XP_035108928.1 uncharacterized protein LOC118143221 [Callithrix jacchus]
MSRYQESHSSPHSHMGHPNNTSFQARTPGWIKCTGPNEVKSLKHHHTPSSESSSYRSCSEQPFSLGSSRLPLGRICMGRPYHSNYVETSHLVKPKAARKPACQESPCCPLCMDRLSDPSSHAFLDQLIQGINYLDRSTNTFNSCHKTLQSLPKLAANYVERVANSLDLDHQDHPLPQSYSSPSTSMAIPDSSTTSKCLVPPLRGASALQCLDDSTNTSYPRRSHCQNSTRTKLPEFPLLGNGLFALSRLPKVWEAIRSGWSAPESVSKPPSWW